MILLLAGAIACGVSVAALCSMRVLGPRAIPGPPAGHPDRRSAEEAGWKWDARRWEATRAAVGLCAAVLVLVLGAPAVAVPAAMLLPSVWVRQCATAARERARRSTTRLIAAVEAALRSGTAAPEALRRGLDAIDDPLARRPVAAALRSFDLGASLDAALREAADRERDDRMGLALGTIAVGIAERIPTERLADLLESVGDRLTFEEGLEDEVRARASGASQQQWILALLVPTIAIYLALTMPQLAATLASDLGRHALVPAAAGFEVAGIVLGRRIVRGALR